MPATPIGLRDHGLLASGRSADINAIVHAALNQAPPRIIAGLPSRAGHLMQTACDQGTTLLAGEPVIDYDPATGGLSGGRCRAEGTQGAGASA